MGASGGGRLFEGKGGAYFKFWPIERTLIRRALIRGGAGALIRGFTVLVYTAINKVTLVGINYLSYLTWEEINSIT